MALRDIFKKKAKKDKPAEKPKQLKEKEVPKEPVLEKKKPSELRTPQVKREARIREAWRILKSPHITERATDLIKKNQYVFKVLPGANKIEIKKAVEDLYGVDVVWVRVIKIASKKRRLGRIEGFKKGYKKAIIRIKEGQKIEVLPR